MKKHILKDFIGGWFIGDFEPSLLKTGAVEVAVKTYAKGHKESSHFHRVATEFTVIVSGRVKMSDIDFSEGDIIQINPLERTDFLAITDVTTVVVKIPGALNDKFII